MLDEELLFQCPCCNAELGVDTSGELFLLEEAPLESNQTKGLGGLRVTHSGSTPADMTLFNQQIKPQRDSLINVPVLGNHPRALDYEKEKAAKALNAANKKDLRSRSISPTTTTTTTNEQPHD